MRISVIAREILSHGLCLAAAESAAVADLQFVRKGLHDNPEVLRESVQERINGVDRTQTRAMVLGYGLCSNGRAGLRAGGVPLVVLRVHDCITLFLGSRERYAGIFAQRPGTYYYTSGWLERGGDRTPQPADTSGGLMDQAYEDLVARYGEDNARYLMEFQGHWRTNYTHACYVRMPLSQREKYPEQVRQIAKENGWEYLEIEGDEALVRGMVSGDWDETGFLIVPPGQAVAASYDGCVLRCAAGGCQG